MPSQPPIGQQWVQQGQAISLQSTTKEYLLNSASVRLLKGPVTSSLRHNGIVPVMRVLNNRSVDRDFNDAYAAGIVPVSPLPCKASSVRPVREINEEGKLPSNILPFNHKEVKEVKEPNGDASIFPDRELLLNCK
jgi:hypothetical protein